MLRWTKFTVASLVVLVLLSAAAVGAWEWYLVANVGRATSQIGGSR